MKHRHLLATGAYGFSFAAIDDIIERGTLEDWLTLLEAAETDIAIAEKILAIASATEHYGGSKLFERFISGRYPTLRTKAHIL